MQGGWVEMAKVHVIYCEMCQTENGKSSRVCMIDFDTDVIVLDQLVNRPITALSIFTCNSDPRQTPQLSVQKAVWESEVKKGKEVDR
ncbi:hypothetical protein BD410DRAFT_795611 [Rickenella mellea]|uniref:Uncharacterized protein n=1 Tax=Rickenella mellea TaxID=50990 RepID=A0A4Y7PKX3_9AGAM|nr:hypothetical protein BD410DRAFT_795611 [Rickenella mellea]